MEYNIGDEESVSLAVVHAVSAVVGRDPSSLTPLAGVVDPDALDTLFGPQRGTGDADGRVSFSFVYADCRVTVESNESLVVAPIDQSTGERQRSR